MSVHEPQRIKAGLIDTIEFMSLTKNLNDDETFYVWISKLFQFSRSMTIRYMLKNKDKYTDPTNRELYRQLLSINKLDRFAI